MGQNFDFISYVIITMETKTREHKTLVLSCNDVKKLLPDEKFEYNLYWDYRDTIDEKTFKECMPDEDGYKREDWSINYEEFVNDWRNYIEDEIRDWNISYITEEVDRELRELVENALRKKGVEYDDFEFEFYADELYTINLNVDEVLRKSPIVWNVVRHNNYDGFTEWEAEEDGQAIKEFLELNPWLAKKEDLESAVNDWMYTWSDLKVNYKTSMQEFLEALESGKKDISYTEAVLHLSINGSGSPAFTLWKWEVEFWKKMKTDFDYWDWSFDGGYGVEETYWCAFNS